VPGTTSFYDILVRDGNGDDITESDFLKWKDVYNPDAQDILSELMVRRYSEPNDDCPPRTIILETAN
jgi:hypothetical protein